MATRKLRIVEIAKVILPILVGILTTLSNASKVSEGVRNAGGLIDFQKSFNKNESQHDAGCSSIHLEDGSSIGAGASIGNNSCNQSTHNVNIRGLTPEQFLEIIKQLSSFDLVEVHKNGVSSATRDTQIGVSEVDVTNLQGSVESLPSKIDQTFVHILESNQVDLQIAFNLTLWNKRVSKTGTTTVVNQLDGFPFEIPPPKVPVPVVPPLPSAVPEIVEVSEPSTVFSLNLALIGLFFLTKSQSRRIGKTKN